MKLTAKLEKILTDEIESIEDDLESIDDSIEKLSYLSKPSTKESIIDKVFSWLWRNLIPIDSLTLLIFLISLFNIPVILTESQMNWLMAFSIIESCIIVKLVKLIFPREWQRTLTPICILTLFLFFISLFFIHDIFTESQIHWLTAFSIVESCIIVKLVTLIFSRK